MNDTMISVVIPIYKVEAYLPACVESVRRQTYEDIEILLVDDGSPDGCPAMCDALAREDSRITVIHKENGGLSSARNAGLDIAAGRYIAFVDSDDRIHPEMLERLHRALTEADADLSICGVRRTDEKGAPTGDPLVPLPREVLTGRQAHERLEFPSDCWRYTTAWNKLYKRELFDGLRFPEGRLHEDEFTVHLIFDRCGTVAVIPDELYLYTQRGGSIMSVRSAVQRLDSVEAGLAQYRFYSDKGMRRLAMARLRRTYRRLRTVLRELDAAQHKEALAPYVRTVAGELARHGEPRAALLWLEYRARLFLGKCAAIMEEKEHTTEK